MAPSDLTCLLPGAQLCGEIITAYLRLINSEAVPGDPDSLSEGLAARRMEKDQAANQERRSLEPGIGAFPDQPSRRRTAEALVAAWPKRREIRAYNSLRYPCLEEAGCVKDFFTSLAQESGENPTEEEWRVEGTSPETPHQTASHAECMCACLQRNCLERGG